MGAGLLALLYWIGEQLLGNALSDFIYSRLPLPHTFFTNIFEWIKNHPGDLSLILFFVVLIVILILSYLETRPPSGITLLVAPTGKDLGILEGVRIINNTGGDLLRCWVDATEWNAEPKLSRRRIKWEGVHYQLDIPDGQGNSAYFVYRYNGTMRATIGDMDGPQLPEGKTEIGLCFHANTLDAQTITMYFWSDVDIQLIDNRHEITIQKVTK